MNTVVIDRTGRIVRHRKTHRGQPALEYTLVDVQRGILRSIVRAQARSRARRAAGRYPW